MSFQQFFSGEPPAFEHVQWVDGKFTEVSDGKARWSKEEPPPKIGDKIVVTMNSCGPAKVVGYFVQDRWLGVICDLLDPPDWHKKQNHGNPRGHVFGPEFRFPKEGEQL